MSPEALRPLEERSPRLDPGSSLDRPSLITRWSAVVESAPDAPALLGDGTTLTRAQLDRHAARLARLLRDRAPIDPATPEPVVAVLAPHGAATVVAILAVLRAGFGYLVLDPRWPAARLAACCAAARPIAVLVTDSTAAAAPGTTGAPVGVDHDAAATATDDTRAGGAVDSTDALAYLLFTSGSTGVPKAVRQSHRGVLVCADNQRAALDLAAGDVLTLLTPFCYDMAAVDLWSALLSGAALAPYDLGARGLAGLGSFLERHGVTVFHSAPTVLRTLGLLGERVEGSVRLVLLGGEAAVRRDVAVARTLFGPAVTVASGYGSTEASFSTMLLLHPGGDEEHLQREVVPDDEVVGVHGSSRSSLPMGPALPGYTVELGSEDEILVTGPGVALGYLGDSGEDRGGRFTTAPGGGRTFRTGDLGELQGGRLYHRGRLDRQIKVRGVRIDPAEVEAILLDVPGITGALVGPADSVAGHEPDTLAARLTVRDGIELSATELHRKLSRRLPIAMVPSRFEVVDRLEVTDTGKRVRPSRVAVAVDVTHQSGDPVLDRVTHTVAAVLGVDPATVDPRVPLMESGAHSLDLVRIHAALSRWGEIQLLDLFGLGTVAAIAAHLTTAADAPDRLAPGSTREPDAGLRAARAGAQGVRAQRIGRRAVRVPPRDGR